MPDNNLVKTFMDAAVLTGMAAGIGCVTKKVVKENFTSDQSSSVMAAKKTPNGLLRAMRWLGQRLSLV